MSPTFLRGAVAAFGAVAISGCVSVPRDAGFDTVAAAVTERTGRRAVWNRSGEDDSAAERAVTELLQTELTPDSAVQIALLNNRNLQATYEDLGVAQADLVQAGLLKNPLFHAEIRFPASPATPIELGVVQSFLELFTIPLRKRVAAAAFEAAKGRVTHAALMAAHDVTAAFYRLQGAQQVLELRQSVVAATDASADTAQRLRAAGNITELALANEQALHAQAKLDLSAAEARVLEHREELGTVLGLWGPATGFRVASRLPDLPSEDVATTGLETLAIAQRLDLAAARSDIASAAQRLGLSSWEQLVPTIDGGFHYEREPEGTITRGPSVELSIPIFDQGQAARFGARAKLRQAQQRYAALAVEIRSRVRRARNEMSAAHARATYLAKVVLPLRRKIVEEIQLRYNAMLTGVFQLLKARQDEIDTAREYIEAITDFWVARAALEGAFGGRLVAPAQDTPASKGEPAGRSPALHDGGTP